MYGQNPKWRFILKSWGTERILFAVLLQRDFMNVCIIKMEISHQSVVAIFFGGCWVSSIRASDSNRLDKIIKKAGSAAGVIFKLLSSRTLRSIPFTIHWSDIRETSPELWQFRSCGDRFGNLSCHMALYNKTSAPSVCWFYRLLLVLIICCTVVPRLSWGIRSKNILQWTKSAK